MEASEIRFIKGRLKFGESNNSAPFPSAVVVFGSGSNPQISGM
jgi:site-specific DNA-methyltransferase (adenine-specific)